MADLLRVVRSQAVFPNVYEAFRKHVQSPSFGAHFEKISRLQLQCLEYALGNDNLPPLSNSAYGPLS
jgi:hypothetical protein